MLLYPHTAIQKAKRKPEIEQQQTIVSNFLSGTDFPALGAEMKLTKPTGQKTKQREETQTEGRAAVFREAYHAQLREVHGANVRAVEATQEDVDDPTERRRYRTLDSEELNSLAEHAIREIAAEGELVTKEKVRSGMLYHQQQNWGKTIQVVVLGIL